MVDRLCATSNDHEGLHEVRMGKLMPAKKDTGQIKPIWISGPSLRQRWDMPISTFHYRVKNGVIPAPVHPFGPNKPYWLVEDIERFEREAISKR